MLSKKKIKIMLQLALYEKGRGKQDLKNIHYYKNDYVRLNILKSIICMSIGYIMILVLIAMYNLEYLIKNAVDLPYKTITYTALGVYMLLLALYILVTIMVYSSGYDESRNKVRRYFKYLKYLNKYYQTDDVSEEEEADHDA